MADESGTPVPVSKRKSTSIIRLLPAFPSPLTPHRSRKRVRLSLKPSRVYIKSVEKQSKSPPQRCYTPLIAVIKSISKELDEVEEGVNRLNLRLKRTVFDGEKHAEAGLKKPIVKRDDCSLDALYRRSFEGRLVAADLYRRSVEGFSRSWMRVRRERK